MTLKLPFDNGKFCRDLFRTSRVASEMDYRATELISWLERNVEPMGENRVGEPPTGVTKRWMLRIDASCPSPRSCNAYRVKPYVLLNVDLDQLLQLEFMIRFS